MTPSTDLSDTQVFSTGNGADPEFEQALAEVLAAAIGHHHANEIDEAEALYKVIVEAQPTQPDANHNLGVIALQRGEFERAVGCFEVAIGANPEQNQYWASYINALNQSGQTSAAWVALELAQQRGMNGPAVDTLIQQMVQGVAAPAESDAVEQAAASQMGGADAASTSAVDASSARARKELSPVPPPQQINRLTALYNQGRTAEALELARAMTVRFPTYPLGWKAIGTALHSQGKIPESLDPLRRAVELAPQDLDARKVLADCLRIVGEYAEAEAECRTIISHAPTHGEAHRILGVTRLAMGQISEAEAYCRKAVELMPNSDVAYSTLGVMLLDQGKLADAEAQFRRSLEIKPDAPISHENILFCLSHNDEVTPEALLAQHLQFGAQCETPLRKLWKRHQNSRKPDRQLRVGFVSGDLYQHAVATFVEPVLTYLARDPSVAVHVYYNYSITDEVNARLRSHVRHWNSVPGMTDAQLADKIRADGIDVLIDLSGHTGRNRLLTFARKPAPIQASWMGYPGTTGLRAMDYYFADAWHVPMEFANGQFVEKIAHLPANAPFQPATLAPPINGLPALHNGFITFGSFNRVSKLRPSAIVLWSRLLRALPDSRMVLGAMPRDASVDTLIEWFANEGISKDRLDFRTRSSIPVYLQQHHHVDICLDTFPYAGGTTTLHAMWMGVPTLTLPGRAMPSRGSTAALAMAGLDGFIATDSDDFVEKGRAWAADLPALAALRAGMRERCAASPMFQPEIIAKGLSNALREMWRRWCAGVEPTPIEAPVRSAA
ncbi:hypothetical protein ASG35_06825 [Burkholderia sp. Leaf177]|uniref:tetratricopeptide repeat protein n=1 Tax=Burkholderia sp. Leaf177 TaxID=1736287 RepID=UPI0006F1D2BB|nr:tetratricopeptide repeat protein [Burkholderia sp. Leaf177]KQR79597.1 hypothetical protein ASG35_06825 [Burkholderia sp. Leaf177]